MTWEGTIPRKRRKQFNQFLQHPDARIRALAARMEREDARERRLQRGEYEPWEVSRFTGDANLDFDVAAANTDVNPTWLELQ